MQHESVVRARKLAPDQGGEMVAFTRQEAGWEWMSFAVTRLLPGQTREARTRGEEMVLLWLGGRSTADWGAGREAVGSREDVFDGLPYALYLPDDHRVTIKAETVCEIAECRVPTKTRLEPFLVKPADVASNLRGGECLASNCRSDRFFLSGRQAGSFRGLHSGWQLVELSSAQARCP